MITVVLAAMAAEPGIDASGLSMAPFDDDVRDPLFVERPGATQSGEAFLGILAMGNFRPSAELTDVAAFNLSAGASFHRSLRVDLLAPLIVTSGDVGRWGPAIGDLRLRTLITLLSPERLVGGAGGPGLGIVGFVDLPSGPVWRDLGWGEPTGGAKLAGTWETRLLTLTADGGVVNRPTLEGSTAGGLTFLAGADVGLMLGRHAAMHLESAVRKPTAGDLGVDANLSLRLPSAVFGGGVGLTEATGTPAFRFFAGGTFASRSRGLQADVDSEGVLTVRDACPLENETLNGYRDEDGCADRLGALSVDVRFKDRAVAAEVLLRQGETLREESVGVDGLVLDVVPGDVWAAEATATCLTGRGSTVTNVEGAVLRIDLQPDRARKVDVRVQDSNGTPVDADVFITTKGPAACVPAERLPIRSGGTRVGVGPGVHTFTATVPLGGTAQVELQPDATDVLLVLEADAVTRQGDQLVTAQPVGFKGMKVEPASFETLDALAATLRSTPLRLEIAAHTDNSATDAVQLRLSRARAESVRTYLIAKGVQGARLVAIGYGPTHPIDTNRTPTGRARNDRVEFIVLESP